ncbi:MAG: chloride channel protein [Paracoccaceae bacterium]|nr:chloride channel protein [Paracoccaceae bacterium]
MRLDNSVDVIKYLIASILVGVILGIGGAFAAQGFRLGIVLVSDYSERLFARDPNIFFYLITLSMALVLVHYSRILINGKPFQSVSDSIYLAHKANNETDLKVGFISTFAAFFSASGGASIGQYGPLVHFGTTLGAWLKKTVPFNFTPDLYIGAGVAASISSGFGAPLAGLIFAHEAILRHYSHKSILAIATASGISYAVSTGIWGDTNIINVSSENFNLLLILVISFLAGPIFGLIAILYMKSLLFFAKLASSDKLSVFFKYLIGVLSLSIIGHFMPEVMGLGAETVSGVLNSSYTLIFLVIILIGKILATSISLNFGFFGGVFSPAILVGAAAGAVVSTFLVTVGIFEDFQQAFVISGIAAVAGAVIGAPICMVIIVLELTNSYAYALASLVGLAISVGYVQVRFGSSYFDVQLLNRGIDISDGRTGLFMTETDILRFAETNFHTIKESETVESAVSLMSKIDQSELIVVNQSGEFIGKTNSLSLFNKEGSLSSAEVIDKDCVFIDHDASLQSAMEIASNFVGEVIPIVHSDQNRAVAIITEGAIFQAYLSKQNQTVEMEKR